MGQASTLSTYTCHAMMYYGDCNAQHLMFARLRRPCHMVHHGTAPRSREAKRGAADPVHQPQCSLGVFTIITRLLLDESIIGYMDVTSRRSHDHDRLFRVASGARCRHQHSRQRDYKRCESSNISMCKQTIALSCDHAPHGSH